MVHLINELLYSHHSWRDIKLNQLVELYISMMIKTLGLSLIGIFIPVYLYQLGYSLESIAIFFVIVYAWRIPFDNLAAWLTGYFGPKHIMVLSHLILISSLSMLLTLESIDWPLWSIAIVNGSAYGLFFIAYHIEFSKIQSAKNSGKQLGKMYQLGKFAGAAGPVLGGFLAQAYGFSIVIGLAIILVLISAVPLLMSPEPVRKQQHITYKGFPWRQTRRNILVNAALGPDQMATLFFWPLYVSIFIFTDNVYLSVGLVTSFGLFSSFMAAKFFGKVIDDQSGGKLLKYGLGLQSMGHLLRIVVQSTGVAYIFNLLTDPFSIAVRMPVNKGVYDEASQYEGYRDVYIAAVLTSSNLARTATWGLFWALVTVADVRLAFIYMFGFAAVILPLTSLHNYKALK